MKACFPMSDHKQGKLFIKIKSTNGTKLDEAFESFISATMMTLEESNYFGQDMSEILENTRIQVGHASNNCVISIPLDSHNVSENFHNSVEESLSMLNDTGIRVSGSIGLGMTLNDILKHVRSF